jgi:hypothetical protein
MECLFLKIGGLELFEQHESLKDTTKLTRELERQLKERQEALAKEEAINSRLESQVSSYLEKKKFEENLTWLRRKKSVLVIINSFFNILNLIEYKFI